VFSVTVPVQHLAGSRTTAKPRRAGWILPLPTMVARSSRKQSPVSYNVLDEDAGVALPSVCHIDPDGSSSTPHSNKILWSATSMKLLRVAAGLRNTCGLTPVRSAPPTWTPGE